MNILFILFIILTLLAFLVLGSSSVYLILSLFLNFVVFITFLSILQHGFFPKTSLFMLLILLSCIILFFANGYNDKTKIAFFCALFIFAILLLILPKIIQLLNITGFHAEEIEELMVLHLHTVLSFDEIITCVILLTMSGAILDASMAITSSMYEVVEHLPTKNQRELFLSGMNMATSLLGANIHTLFFAFIANNLALFFWFYDLKYSLIMIINSKIFVYELAVSLFSATTTALTLPLTAWISSYYFTRKQNTKERL